MSVYIRVALVLSVGHVLRASVLTYCSLNSPDLKSRAGETISSCHAGAIHAQFNLHQYGRGGKKHALPICDPEL